MDHDPYDQPYIQEMDKIIPSKPLGYEGMLSVYRAINLQNLLIVALIFGAMIYFYRTRSEEFPDVGVTIHHRTEQVSYDGKVLYFTYKLGSLKLYHKESDWKSENEAYLLFQRSSRTGLREVSGADFVPLDGYNYRTIGTCFITPSTNKFPTVFQVMALPYSYTFFYGTLLLLEPRLFFLFYAPFGGHFVRGRGWVEIKYDPYPDVPYKDMGKMLYGLSLLLFLFVHA